MNTSGSNISRRSFVKASAVSAAVSAFNFQFVPSTVWGANERINIGCIGIGGKGYDDTFGVANAGAQIVAMCDVADPKQPLPERDSGPYRSRPDTFNAFPDAKFYFDFREMLEQHPDLDGVTVSTPDHTHTHASVMAMRKGMAVYCQKPLTHSLWEARLMTKTARKHGVITQMGNQAHAGEPERRAVELIRAGILGKVKEAHVWTDKPSWPQGLRQYPKPEKVPPGMEWDLWIGPAEFVPYSSKIAPFNWRGLWNFGGGALADMACHIMDTTFWALDLGSPTSVEAKSGGATTISAPDWSTITYQFPTGIQGSPIKMVWYDGKKDGKPNGPPSGLLRGENLRRYDTVIVGDKAFLYFHRKTLNWVVKPTSAIDGFEWPPPTIPRVKGDDPYLEWLNGIKTGLQPLSNFEYSGPLTELVLLGNLAIRLHKKIEWDSKRLQASNIPEADPIIRRQYRKGWEI